MDDDVSDPLFVDLDQLWFLPRRIVLGEDREGLEMLVGPHWGRTHPRDAKQAKETGEDSDDEKIPVVANLLLQLMFTLVDLNHCQLVLNEDQHEYLHPWKRGYGAQLCFYVARGPYSNNLEHVSIINIKI